LFTDPTIQYPYKTTPMTRTFVLLALAITAFASDANAQAAAPVTNYLEFQVETPAMVRRAVAPTYPPAMLRNRVEGEVLVQFVVNESGVADMSTFRVVRSTNIEFTEAAKAAIQATRFSPAKLNGNSVRQVVQQPITFALRNGN
jgi:TonB family protein